MSPQTSAASAPETIGGYHVHRTASLFPLLQGVAREELKKSLADNGQEEPIIVQNRTLIDGRNRLAILLELGRQPVFQEYDSKLQVEEYILIKNLWRRHLTDDQRIMIATQIMLQQETKAAQVRQQDNQGGRGKKAIKNLTANSPQGLRKPTVTQKIAAAVKVTDHQARQAVAVAKHAPELVEPIKKGSMPLRKAARTASERKSVNGAKTAKPTAKKPGYVDVKTRLIYRIRHVMQTYPSTYADLRKGIIEALDQWAAKNTGKTRGERP